MRELARVAEDVLAPADLDVALTFLGDDDPDPVPWDRVQWLARARLFDRALAESRRADDPVWRAGGLIAVAEALAAAQYRTRAARILEEAERQLTQGSDEFHSPWLALNAARIWVGIGRLDRALSRLSNGNAETIGTLLEMARAHPEAAERLRRHGLALARKADSGDGWLAVLNDAAERGDAAAAAEAGRSVSRSTHDPRILMVTAFALTKVGLADQATEAIAPWRAWVQGKTGADRSNLVNAVVPVLASLGRDKDVRAAADMLTGHFSRSNALTRAAVQFHALGRAGMVEEFEKAALAVAEATPTGNDKLRWERNASFNNLALARARRGDVDGALAAAAGVTDPVRWREAAASIIRAAADEGHIGTALPAIDRLAAASRQAEDATGLLKASEGYVRADKAGNAREFLAAAVEIMKRMPTPADGTNLPLLAEILWRLDGKAEAVFGLIDTLGKEESRAAALDRLIEVSASSSPETAVTAAERIPSAADRVLALARIAQAAGRGSPVTP